MPRITSDFQKKLFPQLAMMAGVLVILGGGTLFFGREISGYTDRISSVRTELVQWASSLQSYVAIKSQYETKIIGYTGVLNNLIPQKDKLIDLRKDFQFLAGGDNIDVSFSFAGEQPTASPNISTIGINLNLQGDMEGIFNFIKKLQNFHYLISINSVIIEKKDQVTVATMRGEVFFRK